MTKNTHTQDRLDIHLDSNTPVIDAFSQYPLLDGSKKYTVEVTSFTCPMDIPLLPSSDFWEDDAGNTLNYIFEVRRKRTTDRKIPIIHEQTSLGAPELKGGDVSITAPRLFPQDTAYRLRPTATRRMSTIGGFVYDLQRFFDDLIQKYTTRNDKKILAGLHGGVTVDVTENTRFVDVFLSPNNTVHLFFSQVFTDNFFLQVTPYGQKLMGISTEYIAFSTDTSTTPHTIVTGIDALVKITENQPTLLTGGTAQTVEFVCDYPLTKYFDHRVRLELESQMGISTSSVWATSNSQQLAHVLATFPITHEVTTMVQCDNMGATTQCTIQEDMPFGMRTFREAHNKTNEKFALLNSQYFHNIRLEIFLVKRKFINNEFKFKRAKLKLEDHQFWSAKLRFQSI